jgi:hypothetical protein
MAGIQRVQRSATLRARTYAELRELEAPIHNDLASVLVGNEEGWFLFDDTDVRSDDGVDIIEPDDSTPGSWIRTDFGVDKLKNASRVDEEDDGDTLYIGDALPGTANSSASWSIKKIVFTVDGNGNTDAVTTWADGNSNRDNIWDNRLSLTYT